MIPNNLPDQIADLYGKLAEMDRRSRNRRRTGTIAEIDYDKGKYRVKISEQDGKPFLTSWVKTRQLGAGLVKVDVLLQAGEQVDVISENGDGTDAVIDLSTYSDSNERTNKDTPYLISIGDASFALSGDTLTQTAGTIKLIGDVEVTGTITCNDKDISDTHKHKDVMPGGSLSGVPV